MLNSFNRFMFNCSSAAPLLLIFSIVWYIQEKTIDAPVVVCLLIAVFLLLYALCIFNKARDDVSPTPIRVTGAAPNDDAVFIYIIAYLTPFLSLTEITDISIATTLLIGITIIITAGCLNRAFPNIILWCGKYHFYSISDENGISYILISRRTLKNTTDVTKVKNIFDYFMLDAEVR